MEALKAEDSTKTYKWEYFIGKYGHFTAQTDTTRTYPGSSGLDTIVRWSHGGMKEWGATCGIPIAAACVVQQAVPDNQTEHLINQVFANYGSALHPQTDVTNQPWFYDGVRAGQISRMPLKQVKAGSMQCHNAIERFIKAGDTYSPRKARQEWCGRITADQCYITLKVINNYYYPTSTYEHTALPTTVDSCGVDGCHLETGNPKARTLGKEDCVVCHK